VLVLVLVLVLVGLGFRGITPAAARSARQGEAVRHASSARAPRHRRRAPGGPPAPAAPPGEGHTADEAVFR